MNNKLVIISNDQFYLNEKNYYCDHIAEKTLPDGLSDRFSITVIGRSTKIKRHHKLETKNIEPYSNIMLYLLAIYKKKMKDKSKFLILSISPFTFLASLLFIFSKQKPLVYLRSDGHEEYKSILGFYGPILYRIMFNITAKISQFVSCREHILKNKSGIIVSPSELTNNWSQNITKANVKKIKLLYVGRIKVEKGIFSLLELIKDDLNDIALTIVGENIELKSKINQNNVNIFPIENNEKNLIKFYDQHNIFVLPSYTEGYPMVLLESLARMRPVIIFNEIEHVMENKYGIFVTKRNTKSFFDTINYIKENYDEIYEKMKRNKLPTKKQFLKEFENLIFDSN